MTDTQDLSHLRALAAEWLDRGCDVDDLRCEGGSTSVNKLMRAYVAATEPAKVIALLDKLETAQAEVAAKEEAIRILLARNKWLEACTAGASPVQPEGWKLVPVEPTEAMCRALFRNLIHADNEAYVIKAVMAAAPSTKEDL